MNEKTDYKEKNLIRENQIISLAKRFNWSLKNDKDYWEFKETENPYIKRKVPYLRFGFWVDVNFSFFHVKPKNYKVFIKDLVTNDKMFYSLSLRIFINGKQVVTIPNYPSKDSKQDGYSYELEEIYVCCLEKKQFEEIPPDSLGEYTVKLLFYHKNLSPKYGWAIEGGRLVEIDNKDILSIKQNNNGSLILLNEGPEEDKQEVEILDKDISNSINENKEENLYIFKRLDSKVESEEKVIQKMGDYSLPTNLTKYLYEFLQFDEILQFSSVNSFIRKKFLDYTNENIDKFPYNLLKSIKQYKLINQSGKNKKLKNKYLFPTKSDKIINLLEIRNNKKSYFSIARNFPWGGKGPEKRVRWSYDGGTVISVSDSRDLDTNFYFLHVKPGYYKIFINEQFENESFVNGMTLSIFINQKKIKKIEFPYKAIYTLKNRNHEEKSLSEDLVGFIDISQFEDLTPDSNGDFTVIIQFVHINLHLNCGWFIDGGRLEQIDRDTMEKGINELTVLESKK